jgi:hypothetical protein
MAKFVSFTAFDGEDDLEQPVFKPVAVNVEQIRSFTFRKNRKPGTLLIFANGSMFSVKEDFNEVAGLVTGPENILTVEIPAPPPAVQREPEPSPTEYN